MTIRVVKPGILSTLQGRGRRGYARFGVNAGGAIDTAALRLVNLLVGNDENEAAIELHFPAGEFEIAADCVIAIGGADFGLTINSDSAEMWTATRLQSGDVLRFVEKTGGSRAYLAIAGGFAVDEWLGGRSTNLAAGVGGLEGRALKSGDILGVRESRTDKVAGLRISPRLIPHYGSFPTVRLIEGPEFDQLDDKSKVMLRNASFAITSDSNRMGFRLAGPVLSRSRSSEMLSSPVTFGTVQLLPSGQLIILMADHQTSGGYPRIANAIGSDLPILGQLSAGDKVAFQFTNLDDAVELTRDFEHDLAFLRTGCKFAASSTR